ncbi:MAG: NADH-quinone oxidoreductase subunit NuoB [Chloroflexi bacterium]|nr:NADH-quinone oxidoreductase subunit NuoB [Chloroflexota bacterium]
MPLRANVRSFSAMVSNNSTCYGCDLEILALEAPRYCERCQFKLTFVQDTQQANLLLCTGVVTQQPKDQLRQKYNEMPTPKFVAAIGSCALSGGVFHNCYNVYGPVDKVIPVDVYIPGCPPRPQAVLAGLEKLKQAIKNGMS